MKSTSQIWVFVAATAVSLTVLAPAGPAGAADATRPGVRGDRPPASDPNGNDYHANYQSNYHANYSVSQDGRPAQPPADPNQDRDGRRDARRFQDGDRATRSPYGGRR
jgi:hypothetical protein